MADTLPDLDSYYFHLSTQILFDTFADSSLDIMSYNESGDLHLDGVRMYQKNRILRPNYVYVLQSSQCDVSLSKYPDICFLIAGETDVSYFHPSSTVLMVGKEKDFPEIINLAQQTFERYSNWDLQLHLAMNGDNPIEDMLSASLNIFHNPMFVHDTNYYILACPRQVPGMSVWERDKRTGRLMVPLSLIHDFKFEMEYMRTLTTTGVDTYAQDTRGYRIMYRNLFIGDNYAGRICVDELQSVFLPGTEETLEYLSTLIELCILNRNVFRTDMGVDPREFMQSILDNETPDIGKVQDFLVYQGWNKNDRYLCLRLEAGANTEQMHSAMATLGHIELQIPDGCAFVYEQGIAVCVNLTCKNSSISEIVSSLAIILREGLFKMGVSSEIHDFLYFRQGYIQARAALRLGRQSGSMIWCYRFDDYMMDYVLDRSIQMISPTLLCSPKLRILKQYDAHNHTELYHTLRLYLSLERNVLQTANKLFIHRSTLFYRLERIQKLAKVNLDDPQERLTLQYSFALMDLVKEPEN